MQIKICDIENITMECNYIALGICIYSKITHDINSLNISIRTLVTLTHVIFDTTPTVLMLT